MIGQRERTPEEILREDAAHVKVSTVVLGGQKYDAQASAVYDLAGKTRDEWTPVQWLHVLEYLDACNMKAPAWIDAGCPTGAPRCPKQQEDLL